MKLQLNTVLVFALFTLCVSCGEGQGEAERACGLLCADLNTCGLLPSALSAGESGDRGVKNCELRCQMSSEKVRDMTVQCVPPEPVDGGRAHWCSPSSPCPKIRNCLLGAFSDDIPVVGSSELTVGFGVGHLPESVCSEICGTDSMLGVNEVCTEARLSAEQRILPISECSDPFEGGECFECSESSCSSTTCACQDDQNTDWCCQIGSCNWLGSQEWCAALDMNTVQTFIAQDGVERTAAEQSCTESLNWQERFTDLLPGRVRVGARFRGSCQGGMCGCGLEDNTDVSCAMDAGEDEGGQSEPTCDGGVYEDAGVSSWCFVVYGQEVVVSAGKTMASTILLPSVGGLEAQLKTIFSDDGAASPNVYYCENTAALCSDARDNDGDEAIDCADSECSEFCGAGGEEKARQQ